MSQRTHFLARLIGLFLVGMAIPMAFNRTSMLETITAIVHEPELLFTFGMIALAIGLAIVIGHNVWSGGAATIVVTLFGWAMLLKGALLFMPSAAMIGLYQFVRFGDFYYAYCTAILLIGLFLTYASLRVQPAADPAAAR